MTHEDHNKMYENERVKVSRDQQERELAEFFASVRMPGFTATMAGKEEPSLRVGVSDAARRLAEMDRVPGQPGQRLSLWTQVKRFAGATSMVLASPRWRKPTLAAAAVLIFCGLVWAGTEIYGEYAQRLQEIANLRREYDRAWSALRFEEVIQPVVRVLPAASGGKPDRIRVELSPRIEGGLVRDVSISWGDAGDVWETVYEAQGTAKGFQAVHKYALPPAGQTRQWTLRILYAVPDVVASARRLSPDQLTSVCGVEATADGVRLLAETDIKGPAPELATSGDHKVVWLSPLSGSEAGWKVKVTLQSPTATELVTLLVRPASGNTYYVQGGARRLPGGTLESFEVQLGEPDSAIGTDFDVLAVCSNAFVPDRWSLDLSQVPHSAVVGPITLRKVAGTIHLVQGKETARDFIGVEGEIWTSHGGALLMKEGDRDRVLKAFPASNGGTRFAESLTLNQANCRAIRLLVYQEGESALQIGQSLSSLPTESWLYRCSNTADDVQRKPLEQGEGK